MNCQVDVSNVNWNLLRKQKLTLLNVIFPDKIKKSQLELLDGLLEFIDYIQDEAEKTLGRDVVFGKF